LRGNSYVLDEYGNQVFQVEGKLFSLSVQKTLMDMQGRVLYVIRNKIFSPFLSTVYIYTPDNVFVASISRQVFSFRHQYVIEGVKDNLVFDGSLFSLHGRLTIYRGGMPIGTIHRQLFRLADSFVLNADNNEDMPFLVALVIAHDNIHDKEDGDAD
jgi:uncharacterized protein YxjI